MIDREEVLTYHANSSGAEKKESLELHRDGVA